MAVIYPPAKKKKDTVVAATSNPGTVSSINIVGPDGKIKNVDWNGNIQSQVDGANIVLGQSGNTVTSNLANSYTNEQLVALGKVMTKLGLPKFKDYEAIKTALVQNFAGIEGDFNQVLTALTERVIPGSDTTAGKYGTSVNTNVSKYDPDVLNALVDQTYQATLGRNATEDEKVLRLAEINKQIAAGTKTTTTTFKGGSTTTSQPGFSQERAGIEIAAKAKAEAPGDLETMNQINFHDWVLKNMGA